MPNGKKLAWIVVVGSVLLTIWLNKKDTRDNELRKWLDTRGLVDMERLLRSLGIFEVKDLLQINEDQLASLYVYGASNVRKLTKAVDRALLTEWLKTKSLLILEQTLDTWNIDTLEDLKDLDTAQLNDLAKVLENDNQRKEFIQSVKELQTMDNGSSKDTSGKYTGIVILLYLLIVFISLVSLYVFCGKLLQLVSIVIAKIILTIIGAIVMGFIRALFRNHRGSTPPFNFNLRDWSTFYTSLFPHTNTARNNQRPPSAERRANAAGSNTFNLSLYDRLIGSYVSHNKTDVSWNHGSDLVEVGGSSVATIKFFCRNGSPYALQQSDNLQVCINHFSSNTTIPHVIEPSSIVGSTLVKISFTTRLSGEYDIALKLNGKPLTSDSRIKRLYKPGPVDSEKTVFLQQSNTIVVTAGLYHSMEIIPKDCFGNIAIIIQDYLTAEIRKGGPNGEIINPECVVDRGGGVNRYEILLKVEHPGHYVGNVRYKDCIIGPSSLNIISLSESDSATVDKNVAKKCNVYYEAQLQPGGNAKSRRVYCYPSSKQLQIREYYFLGIIPKRIYTCKVCPQTRISFDGKKDVFTIDDGYQSPVVLTSPHREVLAATFYKFLLKNIGGSEKFQDKQTFFYAEVKRLKNHRIRGELSLTIERHHILENFMLATKGFSNSDWFKKFNVTFKGEEGLDWGGVTRELFQLLCVRCFDPNHKLFMRFCDNPQSLVHPNPKRPPNLKLKHFEIAGRIIGKCLYESALSQPLMVKARFSRSFLAQIIGLRINHKYFESDIPDLYTTKIQYIRDNDVSDLGLVFAEEEFENNEGQPTIVPLIEKGEDIDVTNANKVQYLNLLAQYKLAKCVKDEVESFLKGLNDIIPENLLSIFDENELELLMCGMETVSFNDLKIHAVVSGSSSSFKEVVDWFWNIVSAFTQEEMAKLIQFVTGCSQLPPGGFKDIHPPFQIISSPTHGRLPTAHTCFNQICLPSYDSFEQFQQSLTLAINEGSEGFGFA